MYNGVVGLYSSSKDAATQGKGRVSVPPLGSGSTTAADIQPRIAATAQTHKKRAWWLQCIWSKKSRRACRLQHFDQTPMWQSLRTCLCRAERTRNENLGTFHARVHKWHRPVNLVEVLDKQLDGVNTNDTHGASKTGLLCKQKQNDAHPQKFPGTFKKKCFRKRIRLCIPSRLRKYPVLCSRSGRNHNFRWLFAVCSTPVL